MALAWEQTSDSSRIDDPRPLLITDIGRSSIVADGAKLAISDAQSADNVVTAALGSGTL